MAGILIRGCGVLTMNDQREEIPSGDILIEGDRLRHVGPSLRDPPAGLEVIDGSGKVAVPGFVSAHHHLFQTLLRGFVPNEELPRWLSTCIFPVAPHFRPEDLYNGVRLTLAECIESGVTNVVDWAYNLHSAEHAAATLEGIQEGGVRVQFAYGPSLAKGWGDFDLRMREVEEIRSRYFGAKPVSDRIRLWFGCGGPELQEHDHFREEVKIARSWGVPIHIHLREHHSFEPADAVERMDRWGVLGPDLLLAHAIHLRDHDLDLLARSGTKVSYNVLSNMRAGSGICRVVELRERGVDVALGLDGSMSNDTNDYFLLLRAAIGVQRARWQRADCITVNEILEMATRIGARCLGQEDEVGSLEVGKKADVVLIDPRTLNFAPLNDFAAQLVFCAQPRNVDTVIVGGRILKRKGELVGMDLEEIMAKAQETSRTLTSKAGLQRAELLPHD